MSQLNSHSVCEQKPVTYFSFRKCRLKAKNAMDNVIPTDANDVIT